MVLDQSCPNFESQQKRRLRQCRFNVGPALQTVDQHLTGIEIRESGQITFPSKHVILSLLWSNPCSAELLLSIFHSFNNIVRYLKMEIALAIPASNNEQYLYL